MKEFKIPNGPRLQQTIDGWVGTFIVDGTERAVLFRKRQNRTYRKGRRACGGLMEQCWSKILWVAKLQGGEVIARGLTLTETARAVKEGAER